MIERVVIIGTDRPEPIYHRFDKAVTIDRQGATCGWSDPEAVIVARTRCGRLEQPWRWWSAHIRREHADTFARPCLTCFFEVDR